MPIEKPTVVDGPIEAPKRARGFQPGHARVGGRKAGLPTKRQTAIDICAEKGLGSPIAWMAMAVKTGFAPTPDGKVGTEKISLSDRCRLSETLASFCHARLSAAQVTGKDEGPIAVAALDVTKLMESAELAAMAQTLALNLSGYPTTPKQLPGPEEDQ